MSNKSYQVVAPPILEECKNGNPIALRELKVVDVIGDKMPVETPNKDRRDVSVPGKQKWDKPGAVRYNFNFVKMQIFIL